MHLPTLEMKPQNLFLRAAALGLASSAVAEISTFSPPTRNDVFYSVAVPDSTASSGSGPLLFQIKAPDTVQWVGLAQGTHMAGANMFVLYASSSTQNVTLSPRSGKGHVQPKFNPDAQVTLLDGSGIRDGVMTANVRCDNCLTWQGGSMDPRSSSSSWLFAYKDGQPLSSNSVAEDITFHDNFGGMEVDLSQAKSTATNPFLNYDPSKSATSAGGQGADDGGMANAMTMVKAHGFLMSFAFVLMFPIFALLVPLPVPISVAKVHAPLQALTLAVAISGMGLGIKIAIFADKWKNAHPIIGIIVMSMLILFQPAMGLLQHMHFRRTGGKSLFAYGHRWLGRGAILLGIINGGLGFGLVGVGTPVSPRGAMIAYSVIAGVMGLVYVSVHLFVAVQARRQGRSAAPAEHERKSSNPDTEQTDA
ncbi:hypothetical protein FE257_007212 [Aspergillus nanangensis]|uniref:Cellobiose dehydrogenase n=1 Tax=Aspergillus nanangensis TaxID=2582783 RepID=A0AAD4CPS8_ASPNN|nr:hypothetical protein FE257_007212 [Aspergillus nanangensis]